MNLINYLAEKQLDLRFKKLVKAGLLARDVFPVQILGEKKERLALLCVNGEKVFAVVCTNTNKKAGVSIFTLVGHYLQAPKGAVLNKKQDWVSLSGQYEGLKAPLVIAEDVSIRNVSDNSVG